MDPENSNLVRKLENLLKPLDQGTVDEILTQPLNSKARRMLYTLANERGYHHEKVEAYMESKRASLHMRDTLQFSRYLLERIHDRTSLPKYEL